MHGQVGAVAQHVAGQPVAHEVAHLGALAVKAVRRIARGQLLGVGDVGLVLFGQQRRDLVQHEALAGVVALLGIQVVQRAIGVDTRQRGGDVIAQQHLADRRRALFGARAHFPVELACQ
ncbi:hypothetical protein D3C71_1305220 [compost metagenome]